MTFEQLLSLIPPWLTSLVIVAAALTITLALYAVTWPRVMQLARGRSPVVAGFLEKERGALRLWIVVVVLSLLIHPLPLDDHVARWVSGALTVIFIGLVAWLAITFVELATRLYTRRHRIDVEDNLLARKHITQVRIFRRIAQILIILIAVAAALMSFEAVRQYGVSLLASAGAAGIVVGFAAQPVLSNLLAGVQLALTQPIRIDDAVVVEGEWGWIEEITSTYVVIRIWDWRRLIVPLRYFIETPFQNWTRERAAIIGSVFLYVDYTIPVEAVRRKLQEIVTESRLWDGDVVNLQVTDTSETTVTLRALVSARNSPTAWDLRCEVREKLISWLQEAYPEALPRMRGDVRLKGEGGGVPPSRTAGS